MKHVIHTPTADFAYVETEFEQDDVLVTTDMVGEHQRVVSAVKGEAGVGLSRDHFNAILDEYLKTKTIKNGGDFYEECSAEQRLVLNEIKKSYARTK